MRRRKKKNKIVIIVLLLLVAIAGFHYGYNKLSSSNNKIEVKEEEKPKEYSASLVMVGDLLVHDRLYNAMKTSNGYDFKPALTYIKDIVKEYDIAYYNQETILGGEEIGLSSYPSFNSPYEVGDAMIDAGFNLVSLATNHTLDRGEKAITNSVNYWNEHPSVLAVGSYLSFEERDKVRIKEVNNITYTMLNYTYGTNGIKVPEGKEYLVNVWPCTGNNLESDTKYQEYKEKVKEDIKRVRDKVDVLIVAMHWGVEYTHNPTEYEKDMANYLSSLGVDVIIGTHPHVIQPVTWINNTLVIYSLGNFISAQYQNQSTCTYYKCTVGLMTNFKIEKTVKDNEKTIKITNVENELIYNYYNQSTWRGFIVIPFSNPDIANYLPNYQKVYETYKEVVQRLDNNMVVKEPA